MQTMKNLLTGKSTARLDERALPSMMSLLLESESEPDVEPLETAEVHWMDQIADLIGDDIEGGAEFSWILGKDLPPDELADYTAELDDKWADDTGGMRNYQRGDGPDWNAMVGQEGVRYIKGLTEKGWPRDSILWAGSEGQDEYSGDTYTLLYHWDPGWHSVFIAMNAKTGEVEGSFTTGLIDSTAWFTGGPGTMKKLLGWAKEFKKEGYKEKGGHYGGEDTSSRHGRGPSGMASFLQWATLEKNYLQQG